MLKKCLSLAFIGAAALANGTQATTASAVSCVTINLPSSEVNCGVAKGRAILLSQNTKVRYSIRSTNGQLVSGVPVREDGASLVPEKASSGGGQCNTIRAATGIGSGALFVERTCDMVIVSDAKRYAMQG